MNLFSAVRRLQLIQSLPAMICPRDTRSPKGSSSIPKIPNVWSACYGQSSIRPLSYRGIRKAFQAHISGIEAGHAFKLIKSRHLAPFEDQKSRQLFILLQPQWLSLNTALRGLSNDLASWLWRCFRIGVLSAAFGVNRFSQFRPDDKRA